LPLLLDALQATLQKINLQGLLADLALQLRYTAFLPAPLTQTRKRVARPLAELAPPAVQHVGIDLKGPRHFGDRSPCFEPLQRGQLELPRELPSRQTHDSVLPQLEMEKAFIR
jgi:hypothetical protein